MKLVNQYIIPFTGLNEGEYEFSFDFKKKFFDAHEMLDTRDGNITANVSLNRKPNMLSLKVEVHGFLEIQCDRCLEYFQLPVNYAGNLVVKFGEDVTASTDEIWILPSNQTILDLEQYFFECIGLCIPIQRVHPENEDGSTGCNPEMIDMLQIHSKNADMHDESDPRWNKLKDLLNNINTN